jgi:uncharacterized protein DUF6282
MPLRVSIWLPLVLLFVALPALGQLHDEILAGVIDFHCHTGPDALPRSISDLELARLAKLAGMRGLVLKNHYTMTADRAALVMREVEGIEVFGGIVLNRSVGGLNAEAIRRMIQFEGRRGRVVWLPTFDAENQVRTDKENRPFISVVKDGESVPQLAEIFQLIASNNLVLATGHSSPGESLILVPEAKRIGVKHILITHATELGASRAQMKQMAEWGAIIECVWMPQIKNKDKVAEYADLIKAIGAEHFLISSDLGQYLNPLHTDGMKAFILGLREQGVGDIGIDLMSRKNPARLLGLIE